MQKRERLLGEPEMKTQKLMWTAGLSLIILGLGCEDAVDPTEKRSTYETSVYGTFRGIDGKYMRGDSLLGDVCFDTSSYVYIGKADRRYVFKFHGSVIDNRALAFSIEEAGRVGLWVAHIPPNDNLTGHDIWDIRIEFFPDTPVGDSPHVGRSLFVDNPGRSQGLSFQGDGLKIYVGQDVYLLVKGWRTWRNPC